MTGPLIRIFQEAIYCGQNLTIQKTSVKDSVEQFSEHEFEDIFGIARKNESDEVK